MKKTKKCRSIKIYILGKAPVTGAFSLGKVTNMLSKFILYLVRKKLGLKRFEQFQFVNQKTNAIYWFGEDAIYKYYEDTNRPSGVSLNWLINEECKIRKVHRG